MENLAIQDPNALGPLNSLPPPGGPPQLPPQVRIPALHISGGAYGGTDVYDSGTTPRSDRQ